METNPKGENKMTKTQDLIIDLTLDQNNKYTTTNSTNNWDNNMKILKEWGDAIANKPLALK